MIEHTDPFYLGIEKRIRKEGRQILLVDGDPKHRPFYYTIGNHLKGYPELILIGAFKEEFAKAILNMLSELAQRTSRFEDGQLVRMSKKGLPLQVWDTTMIAKLEYTRQATEFYQHSDYAVQQVVVPDPKGRYPADKGCHRRYRVPLLRSTVAIMQSITRH